MFVIYLQFFFLHIHRKGTELIVSELQKESHISCTDLPTSEKLKILQYFSMYKTIDITM